MDKNKRIKELEKELFNINNNYTYSYLIIKLLNKGALNKLTNKITDTKTNVKITTLIKKKHLSGNEQFLYLLNNTIHILKNDFYFLQNNFDYIIETQLQNEKNTNYLLSKRYAGDNKNIEYFSYNIKKLISYGFYNNIKKLSKKSDLIKKYAKDNKINLRKNIIDSNNGIDIIYEALINISICNVKTLNNTLLFEDIKNYTEETLKKCKVNKETIKKAIQAQYITNWEIMINNYYNKKDALILLSK